MSRFSYPRTVANIPILDLSKRYELKKSIESLERTIFDIERMTMPSYREREQDDVLDTLPRIFSEPALPEPKIEIEYIQKGYTALLDWEKAREDRDSWDKIWLKYHPEAKVHTDIIKEEFHEETRKHKKVAHIRVFRPPGITSDTLTEIIKNWTGRRKIQVPLP